jgi:hypothetical protein
MLESGMLRGALNAPGEDERKEKAYCLRTPFFLGLSEERFFRLKVALQRAGFPAPWKELSEVSRTELVSLLTGTKNLLPVVIEQGWPEFDYSENCWRVGLLKLSESSLFKGREHSGRGYFFGFIRIDQDYSETEAVEAFRNEFRKRWGKRKGGGGAKWQAKLNDLVVMRICKQFRDRDPIKRVEHVARLTTSGFAGCKKWCKERQKAIREKRYVERGISQAAHEETSHARAEACRFFQTLFPGEEPLNC